MAKNKLTAKEIHEGHRSRMMQKLRNASALLTDCELLEITLYYAIPRVNTNPIAHELLRRFGTIENVFHASVEDLMQVEGVGERTAQTLILFGELLNRTAVKEQKVPKKFSFASVKEFLIQSFWGKQNEEFIVMYMDKRDFVIKVSTIAHGTQNGVDINLTELSKEVSLTQPNAIIVSHNHPSGVPYPSASDDDLTMKINFMLELSKIKLYDHIVVAGENYYSYRIEGRLDKLTEKSSFARFSDYIKNA